MRLKVPWLRVAAFLTGCVATVIAFVILNHDFGGPSLIPGGPSYQLTTYVSDAESISSQCLVTYDGVQVGNVTRVTARHGTVRISFTLFHQYAPLPADSTAQIGFRTFFAEPILVLHIPSSASVPVRTLRSGETVPSVPTIDIDQALKLFSYKTQTQMRQLFDAFSKGLDAPDAPQQFNQWIRGQAEAVFDARELFDSVKGETSQIASIISDGTSVLDLLASKDAQVADTVDSAGTVAGALGSQSTALRQTIQQGAALLQEASTLVPQALPVIDSAEPLLSQGIAAVKAVSPAFDQLGPFLHAVGSLVDGLAPGARAALPALRAGAKDTKSLTALARQLQPAFANVVSILRYLAQYEPELGGLIGNFANVFRDQAVHITLGVSAGGLAGIYAPCSSPVGVCTNPYPKPGTVNDPQQFEPGQYPELVPYYPKR